MKRVMHRLRDPLRNSKPNSATRTSVSLSRVPSMVTGTQTYANTEHLSQLRGLGKVALSPEASERQKPCLPVNGVSAVAAGIQSQDCLPLPCPATHVPNLL